MTSAAAKAARLRELHVPGRPVVLPNAWDAASARIVAGAGFPAVATSSAAISACLGWEDGEAAPVEAMLAPAGRIAQAVAAPVSVDLERGYGLPPERLVEASARTGAVGLNIEDSDPRTGAMVDVDEQVGYLRGLRAAAAAIGVDLVINARTDAFLRRYGTAAEQLDRCVDRGNRYLAAGADCVYPLGAVRAADVAALAARIDGPGRSDDHRARRAGRRPGDVRARPSAAGLLAVDRHDGERAVRRRGVPPGRRSHPAGARNRRAECDRLRQQDCSAGCGAVPAWLRWDGSDGVSGLGARVRAAGHRSGRILLRSPASGGDLDAAAGS